MTVNYRGIAVTRVCPLETPWRETRWCFTFSSASLCRENYSRRIKGVELVVRVCVCEVPTRLQRRGELFATTGRHLRHV